MGKYIDEDIRGMKKITCKVAADYLGLSPMAVSIGMRNDLLPIGFVVHTVDRYRDSWSYNIVAERLIAYNHGTINAIEVERIEQNLNKIVECFEEMKRDLLFLLKENEGLEG